MPKDSHHINQLVHCPVGEGHAIKPPCWWLRERQSDFFECVVYQALNVELVGKDVYPDQVFQTWDGIPIQVHVVSALR